MYKQLALVGNEKIIFERFDNIDKLFRMKFLF